VGFTYLSDFSANVQYAIDGTTLDVILTIENTGKNLMPASSGSHPFILKRDSEPLVQFQAAGWFPPDTTRLVPAGIGEELPAELNRETPGPMGEAWDQSLFGWKAPATLIWGAEDLTLELGVGPTDTASGCLQLWSGFGKPVFALEQQTAPADAARVLQRGETRSGLVWLNPGEKLTTHHKFRVGRTR
jgi:aldose 1-epimerase